MQPTITYATRWFLIAAAACAGIECGMRNAECGVKTSLLIGQRPVEKIDLATDYGPLTTDDPQSAIVLAHFDVAAPPGKISRPQASYISIWQLAATIVLFLLWVKTSAWINYDCQTFNLGYAKWNAVQFFPFVVALLMMLVIPFVFFPFSKTLFLAFDLAFRPATPEELASGPAAGPR